MLKKLNVPQTCRGWPAMYSSQLNDLFPSIIVTATTQNKKIVMILIILIIAAAAIIFFSLL